jgi:hypothetical protein
MESTSKVHTQRKIRGSSAIVENAEVIACQLPRTNERTEVLKQTAFFSVMKEKLRSHPDFLHVHFISSHHLVLAQTQSSEILRKR